MPFAMNEGQKKSRARRAQTDASLGAERAFADAVPNATEAMAQRVSDDLIERDRIRADDGVVRFRAKAEDALGRARALPEQSVASERTAADRERKAERQVTDAVLQGERRRSDNAVERQRQEQRRERSDMAIYRKQTDRELSTERHGADDMVAELDQMKCALADARREGHRQSDVLGMVTHDLRSPLCVIALNAQSIVDSTEDASTRADAEEVSRAAARMERLLMDLLDVARIESRTLRIARAPYDVGAFVAEVERSYRPLFSSRKMTFTVEPPVEPFDAAFDHDRIVQVLSNLLGNAMKFTPARGTVRLRVERRDAEVEFALKDSGPGIQSSALPHVFERFGQIDSGSRRGLGLGLYICKEIIESHGGRIWVESEFGKGTEVHFTLPGMGVEPPPSM